MKMKFLSVVCAFALCTVAFNQATAQRTGGTGYNTALGLGIDFGDGTFVGPSIKHFFSPNNVGKAEVLFGDNTTLLSVYYQYHGNIQNAPSLKWTLGLGGSVAFYKYGKDAFFFRPTGGLDYKIPNVPLQFEFDWRPAIRVTNGSNFEAARFGFGFRYAFN